MNGNWTWHTVGIYAQLALGDIATDFWTLKIKNAKRGNDWVFGFMFLCLCWKIIF